MSLFRRSPASQMKNDPAPGCTGADQTLRKPALASDINSEYVDSTKVLRYNNVVLAFCDKFVNRVTALFASCIT